MILLTIDTDWAPEEATRVVLEKVRALKIKTTVFFSAPSPLPFWPELEVGCHPDLSRRFAGRAEGGDLDQAGAEHDAAALAAEGDILKSYRRALPTARAIRTHRFHWHSDLSRLMVQNGFEHDSSLILPYHPGIMGFQVGRLKRWPVWASDHLHLARRLPLDRLAFPNWDRPGLKIFCFHVAYLYLNASSLEGFNMITERLTGSDPSPAGTKAGIWNLFERLAEEIYRTSGGHRLSDIPSEFLVNQGNF